MSTETGCQLDAAASIHLDTKLFHSPVCSGPRPLSCRRGFIVLVESGLRLCHVNFWDPRASPPPPPRPPCPLWSVLQRHLTGRWRCTRLNGETSRVLVLMTALEGGGPRRGPRGSRLALPSHEAWRTHREREVCWSGRGDTIEGRVSCEAKRCDFWCRGPLGILWSG